MLTLGIFLAILWAVTKNLDVCGSTTPEILSADDEHLPESDIERVMLKLVYGQTGVWPRGCVLKNPLQCMFFNIDLKLTVLKNNNNF